ncbi:MAG: glycine cleavage system aminomethyltransferase GcvT [Chlamydiia bacterium]|nr:glycine cleavage system aminomethyltransferase GcvT [Chlamydiia bacterium]
MKYSPLHSRHEALGAKMAPFAGWQMPIHYSSILDEHECVRKRVGVFDVSHMGVIDVIGPDSEKFFEALSTNTIAEKAPGSATYTVFCNEAGGAVDDLIIYRLDKERFFVVANASNRQKDLEHMQKHAAGFDVRISPRFDDCGILAVQGPKAKELIEELVPNATSLKPMQVAEVQFEGEPLILATTGYTGSGGVELIGKSAQILKLWDVLLERGAPYGIQPIGLGARDTLRLEKGFALYGHELTDAIGPMESVSRWTIKGEGRTFLGKEALEAKKISVEIRYPAAVVVSEGIAREGFEVLDEGSVIGAVTSGSFSPTLKKAIALVLIGKKTREGDKLSIRIRNKVVDATVVNLPFIK